MEEEITGWRKAKRKVVQEEETVLDAGGSMRHEGLC